MSENSLIIREKYISKLFKKIQELEDGIDLLGQVDRRILKKNIQAGGAYLDHLESRSRYLQKGGAEGGASPVRGDLAAGALALGNKAEAGGMISLKGVQEAALIAKARLRRQEDALKQAARNIEKLSKNTQELKDDLQNLTGLVKSIKIDIPNLESKKVDINAFSNTIAYNAFWCRKWSNLLYVDHLLPEAQMAELLNTKPENANLKPLSSVPKDKQEEALKDINEATYKVLLEQLGSCTDAEAREMGIKPPPPLTVRPLGDESPSVAPRLSPPLGAEGEEGSLSPPVPAGTPSKRNKYYSNSVTSTDMPDNNYMFSETSFF